MRHTRPFALTALRIAVLVLALAGAALAAILVREHLAVFEGGILKGICGGGGRFDCARVASHPASWMLGLPVALWGLVVYLVLAGLAALSMLLDGAERAAANALATTLATTALVVDGWLAWVMVTQIGAICLYCVTTYAITLLLTILLWIAFLADEDRRAWRALARSWLAPPGSEAPERRRRLGVLATAAITLVGIAVAIGLTAKSVGTMRAEARAQAIDFLHDLQGPPRIDMKRFDGLPSRGPANAPVVIAVVADFQCSWCRGLAASIERVRHEHPDQIRVIFVNSPVSSACDDSVRDDVHPDACWLAEVGVCAAQQGKFWEYHDLLFERIPFSYATQLDVAPLLGRIGLDPARVKQCLESGEAMAAVKRDVALCHELKLEATPSFVINGHPQLGAGYPWALRAIVKAMLGAG